MAIGAELDKAANVLGGLAKKASNPIQAVTLFFTEFFNTTFALVAKNKAYDTFFDQQDAAIKNLFVESSKTEKNITPAIMEQYKAEAKKKQQIGLAIAFFVIIITIVVVYILIQKSTK